jgi:hypothetical protein
LLSLNICIQQKKAQHAFYKTAFLEAFQTYCTVKLMKNVRIFLKRPDGRGLTNLEDDLRGFTEVGGKLSLCPDQQPEYHRVFHAFTHCKKN